MLEYRAEQDHTTISSVLAKELDGIASTLAPELSAVIPGFAAAFTWPDTEPAQLPCCPARPVAGSISAVFGVADHS